jgi:hypothetical protein
MLTEQLLVLRSEIPTDKALMVQDWTEEEYSKIEAISMKEPVVKDLIVKFYLLNEEMVEAKTQNTCELETIQTENEQLRERLFLLDNSLPQMILPPRDATPVPFSDFITDQLHCNESSDSLYLLGL